MRSRLSILGDAKEKYRHSTRRKSERGSNCGPFDRAIYAKNDLFGGKKIAQRGGGYFRAARRKQRRQSACSHAVGGQTGGNRSASRASSVDEAVTTIISLAARDFIVVGCDSLATTSADLVYPYEITSAYFESNGDLKVDAKGKPLLQRAGQIWEKAKGKPIDQLPSVTKLYDLAPVKACVLFAGTARIGNTTISRIVDTFVEQSEIQNELKYTMEWVAQRFREFVLNIYDREVPEKWARPMMEVILSGYSAEHREPELWRLTFSYNRKSTDFECDVHNPVPRGEFNVIFGGQYDVIQRVVNGIDWPSFCSLRERTANALNEYHDEMQAKVHVIDAKITIPKPNFGDQKYNLFENDSGGVTRLFPDVGSLSEQAGIDFVYFLIDVMIKAQQFASSIATVGGKIHVALLTKKTPFRWISKEAFTFESEHIPKFQHA
jgi:hypothetical protein